MGKGVEKCINELKEMQSAMEHDPNNEYLRKKSCDLLIEYNKAKKEEESLLLHKAKDNKAPEPDVFTSKFFKEAWDIVGMDVCKAVQEFFVYGKLLGEVNDIIISLTPKSKNPNSVSDVRPIPCCDVIYKCISKILKNRMKEVLGSFASYSPDSDLDSDPLEDDSSDKDLTKTAESLPTLTTLTSVVHPPPSLFPSSSSPPPSLLSSSSSPPPSLLPSSSSLPSSLLPSSYIYGGAERINSIRERSSAKIHSISSEPIHRIILYSWRDLPTMMQEVETLRGRAKDSKARTMTTTNQGLSLAKIEQIIAHRVVSAIEAIAIYETKTHVAHDLRNQFKH
ncbi:hypothetical protein Tco_1310639 [Tanacetum coccineum]